MTQAQMPFSGSDPLQAIWGFIRRTGSMIAKFSIGALLIMAAGVAALATAMVGLILAMAAIILRSTAKRRMARAGGNPSASNAGNTGGDVLEARRTARGWTVDS